MQYKHNTKITQFTDLIKSAKKYILNSKFYLRYSKPTPLIRRKKLLIGLLILIFIIIPVVFLSLKYARSTVAAWYDTDWLYRKQLTFNNSAQSSNLANFPVLVVLSSSNFDFTQALSAGQDIRFTDSDGSTLLSYEIESYDSVGQTARIWVNVPQIDASSSTDFIYLYWGNSGASDAQSADNTWNSNYKGVYHLNNNAATTVVTDSSGLGNDITASENTNNGFYQSAGKIGGSVLTGGTPTYITNQSGTNISEMYPDIALDGNGYPVIAYTDATNGDLVLVHCNDKECKGGNETVSVVDSTNITGYYPSIQLDNNGYPMIAYQYQTGLDLKYVHCNDVNCAGGDETFSTIESTNSTGYYPRMVKDAAGYPVIAYYYASGADLKIVHCGNIDCSSGNVINSVDTGGTVGNGVHGTDLVLDALGYPVMSYYDTTNTEVKVAHCNDVNCSGGDESLTSPVSTLGKSLGLYTAIELDGSGLPMVAYYNATDLNLEFIHCDDANCAGDETANRIIISAGVYDYYPSMEKNSSGNPVILLSRYGYIANAYLCANTNCSSGTMTYLALYNQMGVAPNFKLDASNNIYVVTYSQGKTGDYDALLFTTKHKLERAYDSDFDFGTGSFSVSAWFKSNGMVQKNTLLSRYDADQGFKLELNFAGQACFGIDDDASWTPDDSACSSNSQVVTNVDNNNATAVSWQSMVLDNNGYPVIAYYDSSGLDLEIIHCNDASCTGNNENFASIDSTGDVGQSPSLVLDTLGYPVISYHDNTNQNLKIVHCGDVNCTSGNTVNTVDGSADDVGDYSTLKLDGNGYPVISYYDVTNTAVKLAHCNDVNCSNADESIVILVNDEDDRVQNGAESLQLDTSGYPMVVYFDNTNSDLKFIHCNDANCDGVGETKTTIETANNVGNFASMTLDTNGYPVIVHFDYTYVNLRLVHCGNVNCTSGNVASAINSINDSYSGLWPLNIKLNASGNPVILSYQPSSWSNILTVCNDVNCAGGDETNSLMREGTSYNYYYHSLALDSNNYPVISYAANGNDLRLIHMTNGTTYTETGNYDDGNWHHLVAVKNGTSSITTYVDGVSVGSDVSLAATGTLTSNSATLNLAEEIGNTLSVNNWSGYLDEVQIDNTARSANWVAAEYLSESNNFINTGITQNGPTAVSLGSYTGDAGALKNNLVGYWKFDEGYSNIANNSGSGSGINGTITGAAWSNTGKFGKALNFSGTSTRVDMGNTAPLQITSDLTISSWIYLSNIDPTNARGIVSKFYNTNGNRGYRLGVTASSGVLTFQTSNDGTATVQVSGNTPVRVNTWTYVSAVYRASAGAVDFYINGKLDTTKTGLATSIYNVGKNFQVGTWDTSTNGHSFVGIIDEVKIYNAALTATEVKMDYNGRAAMVLGTLSDTSGLTGGSIASSSATAAYCVPGSSDSCSSPVGEWNFEEKTGTAINDSSGNNFTANLTGTTSWTTGKIGSAIDFLNTGNATITNTATLEPSSITIEAWVNQTALEDDWIISKQNSTYNDYNYGYLIRTNSPSDTISCRFGYGSNTIAANSTSTLTDNVWYHVVCTYDGSTAKIYINGVNQATTAGGSALDYTSVGDLGIGAHYNNSQRFYGKIDQVRIFNYVRTAAQVAWDYNRGGSIGHWKLNECSGIVANDSSSTGNTGTISIGATVPQTSAGTCTDGESTSAWYNGATGKYNSSLNFDGADDYVYTADSPSLDMGTMTVSAWIKTSSSSEQCVVERNNSTFYFCTSSGKLRYWLTGVGATWTTSNKSVNDNVWHHVLATWDGSNKKLYIDGQLDKTEGGTGGNIGNAAVGINIGVRINAGVPQNYFTGQIDDVRLYNYPLTPTQIKQVYNNGAVNLGPATGSP